MPPSFPSPTSSTGSLIGRNASACNDPEGAGLSTPPAASTNTKFPVQDEEGGEEGRVPLLPLLPSALSPPSLELKMDLTSSTIASTMSVSEAMCPPSRAAARCGDTGSV